MKTLRLAAATALALTTAPAYAATVDLNVRPDSEGGLFVETPPRRLRTSLDGEENTYRAGGFAMQSDDPILGDFLAFCVEYTQGILDSATYEIDPALFSASILTALDGLFDTAFDSVVDPISSAAFQVSIWEIVEQGGTGLDLDAGRFLTTQDTEGAEFDEAVETMADGFLAGLAGPVVTDYDLIFLASPDSQDLVTARRAVVPPPPPPPPAVPLPATGILLLAGLGGLTAMRRRNR